MILLGFGSEQQLGYYDDEVNIYDSLYPFNLSILMLLTIAIFTRYSGKPSLKVKTTPRQKAATTEKSEADDFLTVIDDDMQSVSGFSDIRS